MTPNEPDLDEFRATLEGAGRRCTRQRRAVYAALRRTGHHPTAEEVHRAVKLDLARISLATVYKALEVLVRSGLASRLGGDGGSARYDARGDRHYHLRDLRSGAVEDLPTEYDPDLLAKVDRSLADDLHRRGFRLTGYRLELIGFYEGHPPADGVEP